MPSITLSKKALLAACTKKRTDNELADRISYLGTDLEGIDGDNINVEIFPNRPDLLSQQGFNRAFSSFVGDAAGMKTYRVKKGKGKVIVEEAVTKVRPYTACSIVRGLRFTDELIKDAIQIQEKLHVTYGRNRKRCAIGIYPMEHITLPITYTAKKPGDIKFTPLEAKKEMNGAQILSQHPTGRDYGHLLEGLDKYPIFIDAAGETLSMPPIINSNRTGRITEKTKDVFIECSGFSWHVVHGALAMIVTALAEMGGQIEEMDVDYPKKLGGLKKSPQLEPSEMTFEKDYINKYLGYDLTLKDIQEYLGMMGIGTKGSTALIPAYRTDILHPIDLVEDVAIAYGMERFEATIPAVATIAEEAERERFATRVRQVLIGHGLLEIKNYDITNIDTQKATGNKHPVQVAAAASQEYDTLREGLIGSGLVTLQRNRQHEYPQKLFEIGTTYAKDKKEETGVREELHVSVLLCGEDANYTAARQIMDSLLSALDLTGSVTAKAQTPYLQGRCGTIMLSKKTIGHIGEVHPQTLEHFGLEMPVSAFELDVTALLDAR